MKVRGFRMRGNVEAFTDRVGDIAEEIIEEIRDLAVDYAPKRTGYLASRIAAAEVRRRTVERERIGVELRITEVEYAAAQEKGTGEYATPAQPPIIIVPKSGSLMVFPAALWPKYRGTATKIALPIVVHYGVPATRYMGRAMDDFRATRRWSQMLRPAVRALMSDDG